MSRCFPFPPPGYEARVRPEENLLKEEKHRDKKLKKEKKEKEKREGKDKRKREKGDSKHKEKKDKKEKHRDKKEKHKGKKDKKDKENKRNDNEKSSISEDASLVREPETRSTEKVHTGEVCFVDEDSGINKTKFASLCQRQDEQESIYHSLGRETGESQFVQELGRRIRDEGRATAFTPGRSSVGYTRGNEEISSGSYVRGNEEMHKSALRDLQKLAEVKTRNGNSRVDQRQEEGQALQNGAQFSGTATVLGLPIAVDSKVEPESIPNNSARIVEWTTKCKENGDHKPGEKIKCKDRKEKKNHGKDKGRENEKKNKERTDHISKDQEKSKILYKNGSPGFNDSNSHLLAVDTKIVSTAENVKKRKNVEAKGLVHENDFRHNKLPRVTLYLPKDNGQIACKSLGLLDSNRKGIPPQDKEDIKNCEVSGTVDAPSSYTSKQMSPPAFAKPCQLMKDSIEAPPADKVVKESSELPQASVAVEASVKRPPVDNAIKVSRKSLQGWEVVEGSKKDHHADKIAKPSRKSPHPDMKYLNQVLSVPERKEWPEVDDEDWLFSGKDPLFQKQKPDVSASCDYEHQQVWSEILHVEAADIYALPYVIPY